MTDAELLKIEADRRRAAAKEERARAVERITVTTAAGNTFDGDEESQGRMTRAIVAMQANGIDVYPGKWILADNTPLDQPSMAELAEALALAGMAQGALWVMAS